MSVLEEYTRRMDQINRNLGNMGIRLDYVNKMQNQLNAIYKKPYFIAIQNQQDIFQRMSSNLTYTNYLLQGGNMMDFISLIKSFEKFNTWNKIIASGFSLGAFQYNYDKLSKIAENAIKTIDCSKKFKVDSFVDKVAEQYLEESTDKSSAKGNSALDSKLCIKDVRDWIAFVISVVSFIFTIYGIVSTKPAIEHNNTLEVNN